ncbi:MAG: hypothetical protein ACREUK_01465 [Burkholderiales bacterium]
MEEHKVDVKAGGSTDGETMAVIPLSEQADIPFRWNWIKQVSEPEPGWDRDPDPPVYSD